MNWFIGLIFSIILVFASIYIISTMINSIIYRILFKKWFKKQGIKKVDNTNEDLNN